MDYNTLLKKYSSFVLKMVNAFTKGFKKEDFDRDDFIQIARIGLWWSCLHYEKIVGGCSFEAYAGTIINYRLIDEWRRWRWGSRRNPVTMVKLEDLMHESNPSLVAVNEENLDQIIDKILLKKSLHQHIQKLPPTQKNLIYLHYYNDLNIGVLARDLGVSRNAVDSAIKRGLTQLKKTAANRIGCEII